MSLAWPGSASSSTSTKFFVNENGTRIPSAKTARMADESGSYFASRKRRRSTSVFSTRNFFVKNWTSTKSRETNLMIQLRMSWDESVGQVKVGSRLRNAVTNSSR